MKSFRRQIKYPLLFIVALIFLTYISIQIISFSPWKPIQVLESPDRTHPHTATLSRLYGYIDANFKIILDGKRIYSSPDFAPNNTLAFREFMTWDDSGKILIFIVADKILFAYDTEKSQSLPSDAFTTLKLQLPTLRDLHYEGILPK